MTTPNYKNFYDAVIDHLIVIGIYQNHHEHNPRQALRDIISWEIDVDHYFEEDEGIDSEL